MPTTPMQYAVLGRARPPDGPFGVRKPYTARPEAGPYPLTRWRQNWSDLG
jgi:hypothetical protein